MNPVAVKQGKLNGEYETLNWQGPFEIINPASEAPVAFTCDHASNVLPPDITDLGVSPHDLQRHIAWDIGASGITRHLAKIFDAPAILCGTSRLVIDCNRQLHDPTLIPDMSDGTPVPGNRNISASERERRLREYFMSYHTACSGIIEARLLRGIRPLFVAVHTMTDRMHGKYRPWEISLSSNAIRQPTDALLSALRSVPGLRVGDNEPYDMDPAQDYSTPKHALSRGLPYIQVEFRQDLVATAEGELRYATIFADALKCALPNIIR